MKKLRRIGLNRASAGDTAVLYAFRHDGSPTQHKYLPIVKSSARALYVRHRNGKIVAYRRRDGQRWGGGAFGRGQAIRSVYACPTPDEIERIRDAEANL